MSTVSNSVILRPAPAGPDRGALLFNLLLLAVVAVALFDTYSLLIALR